MAIPLRAMRRDAGPGGIRRRGLVLDPLSAALDPARADGPAARAVRSLIRIAVEDLDHLTTVYPGTRAYPLSDKVPVVPLGVLASGEVSPLVGLRGSRR